MAFKQFVHGDPTRPKGIIDAATKLHDTATAITASDDGQVGAADQILYVGDGLFTAAAIIDVSALAIDGGDEAYRFIVEGAEEVAMGTTLVPLAEIQLGALEALGEGSSRYKVDSVVGRYQILFTNERAGVQYSYIRLRIVHAGVSSSITFQAYVTKLHLASA